MACGDFEPLAQAAQRFGAYLARCNQGLYMAVTCTEDLPHVDASRARRAAEVILRGDYRVRPQKEACLFWPRGRLPVGVV